MISGIPPILFCGAPACPRGLYNPRMKKDIHPKYHRVKARCSCGNELTIGTVRSEDLALEVCSKCHPFYTGKQKLVDTFGQAQKFMRKYGR